MTSRECPTDVQRTQRGRATDNLTQIETETERTIKSRPNGSESGSRPATSDIEITGRIRSMNALDALTRTLIDVRPDWPPAALWQALAYDDRPWDVIRDAAWAAAHDATVRHPNRIRHTNPPGATPAPRALTIAEARSLTECPNGALHTPHPCALCRAGLTEETT